MYVSENIIKDLIQLFLTKQQMFKTKTAKINVKSVTDITGVLGMAKDEPTCRVNVGES